MVRPQIPRLSAQRNADAHFASAPDKTTLLVYILLSGARLVWKLKTKISACGPFATTLSLTHSVNRCRRSLAAGGFLSRQNNQRLGLGINDSREQPIAP
jgi:hypothetical protein